MFNRRGTGSTLARLSRAKVIPSYVSSPDVLLTVIDFHLFISALRICSHFLFFFSKPQNGNRATARDCFAEILNFIWLRLFLGFLSLRTFYNAATCVVTPPPLRRDKLPQP